MDAKPKLFISRAGADEAFSTEIALMLQVDGYEVILQQQDFANKNFLNEMHEALASGARVVGLLSAEYLASKNCRAEWVNALAGDPLNEKGRLILLRVAECEPVGLLSGIAYWDLHPIRDNPALVADVVRNAVKEGGRRDLTPVAGPYWREPRTITDPDAVRETASFTGRQAELDAVEAALWNGRGVAAIHGLGGMGKSVLAREYSRRNAGRYAAVWRLHAQTENGVIDGLLRLGAWLAPELEKVHDRRAAAFEVISTVLNHFDKPVLLVFDNLEDEAMLRDWRPRARSHLLATSRNTGWGRDVAVIRLDSFPVSDAVSYLRRESGRDDENLSLADAQMIVDALGSLPLALSHAAAYLKRTKTVTATSYLARIEHHLTTAPKGAEYEQAVVATFREAITKAEEDAPGANALLCFFSFFSPDAIPEELCHQGVSVSGLLPVLAPESAADFNTSVADPATIAEALGSLDRLSLITFEPSTRTLTMHSLVQRVARTLLASDIGWVLAAIAAMDEAFPDVDYETWPICERLLPHALAVLSAFQPDSAYAPASRLANHCALYLRARAEYARAEELMWRALAIGEATYGPDHPAIATYLVNLAGILRIRNQRSEVDDLYRRAIEIAEKYYGPDHTTVATVLNNRATFLNDTANFAEAEPLLRRALAIDEAQNGPEAPAVAIRLSNLANLLARTKRLSEAVPLSRRALAIAEKGHGVNHPDIAVRLSNLALILDQLDKKDEAEEAIRRALVIDEVNYGQDHPLVAVRLVNLAGILGSGGRRSECEGYLRRALSINEKTYGLQHPAVMNVLNGLAVLLYSEGRVAEAQVLHQRASAMRDAIGGATPPTVL